MSTFVCDAIRRSPQNVSNIVHRPEVDGLRALAVAAVVAFHLGLLPGGYIGVDVFL